MIGIICVDAWQCFFEKGFNDPDKVFATYSKEKYTNLVKLLKWAESNDNCIIHNINYNTRPTIIDTHNIKHTTSRVPLCKYDILICCGMSFDGCIFHRGYEKFKGFGETCYCSEASYLWVDGQNQPMHIKKDRGLLDQAEKDFLKKKGINNILLDELM